MTVNIHTNMTRTSLCNGITARLTYDDRIRYKAPSR